jgi:hypothetical protein
MQNEADSLLYEVLSMDPALLRSCLRYEKAASDEMPRIEGAKREIASNRTGGFPHRYLDDILDDWILLSTPRFLIY